MDVVEIRVAGPAAVEEQAATCEKAAVEEQAATGEKAAVEEQAAIASR